MIVTKNVKVLDSELKRLMALYPKALATKNDATVDTLRKSIKHLKQKIAIIEDSTFQLN